MPYTKIELTKVVLKCIHSYNSNEITNYYKITKKLFSDEPYKIYFTYAIFENDKYQPSLEGYWNQSEESKSAKENVLKKKDISKYSYPDWYLFVGLSKEKNGDYSKQRLYVFINRETLKLESHWFDVDKNESQCEISDDKNFDETYESDKNSKIKLKRFNHIVD